jgi:imidazolonepropionase-like amidohydrolase
MERRTTAPTCFGGTLATAPRGHPTQLGLDEGFPEIGPMPTLDAPTVEALVTAAHARDLLVVTHVHSAAAARTAIDAGTDGLAHMFNDVLPDDELIDLAVGADVCVIATLPVMEHIGDDARPDRTIADDSELRPFLTDQDRRSLADPYTGFDSVGIDQAQGGIRLLAAAGVAIIAGSDAPNPGTAYGASLHREVELLSESGLSATDALAAATSVPAERFGLDDRGRIAEGRRADLVLVDGDPTTDILATRAIVGVWKAGVAMDRDAFRTDR